jgi:hypothetical protein
MIPAKKTEAATMEANKNKDVHFTETVDGDNVPIFNVSINKIGGQPYSREDELKAGVIIGITKEGKTLHGIFGDLDIVENKSEIMRGMLGALVELDVPDELGEIKNLLISIITGEAFVEDWDGDGEEPAGIFNAAAAEAEAEQEAANGTGV